MIRLQIYSPSELKAILLVIETPESASPPMIEESGEHLITIRVSTGSNHRTITARLEPEIYKPDVKLTLWQQKGMLPTQLMATAAGEAAPLRELLEELTEGFAPQLTPALDSFISEQWRAFDRQSGLDV